MKCLVSVLVVSGSQIVKQGRRSLRGGWQALWVLGLHVDIDKVSMLPPLESKKRVA